MNRLEALGEDRCCIFTDNVTSVIDDSRHTPTDSLSPRGSLSYPILSDDSPFASRMNHTDTLRPILSADSPFAPRVNHADTLRSVAIGLAMDIELDPYLSVIHGASLVVIPSVNPWLRIELAPWRLRWSSQSIFIR